MGNFVLKTPLIAAIHCHYPNAVIDIITGSGFSAASVLGDSGLVREIHCLNPQSEWWEKLRFFIALRRYQYDYLLLPFDADRRFLRIGARIAGIKRLIRHQLLKNLLNKHHHKIHHQSVVMSQVPLTDEMMPSKNDGQLQINEQDTSFLPLIHPRHVSFINSLISFEPLYRVPLLPNRHEVDLNLDLLRAILCIETYQKGIKNTGNLSFDTTFPLTATPTFVAYQPDPNLLTRYGLTEKQYIVLQPGAANGLYAAKVWSPDNFKELIRLLWQQYQIPIILVGDEGDNRVFVAPIATAFEHVNYVVNTAGITTFQELLHLLANARFTICHDSGTMHLADALGAPLLALYGPTDYSRTHPRRPSSHTLMSDTPYKGIMHYFAIDEVNLTAQGIGHKAMDGILVGDVMDKLRFLYP